jgi:hypothetical protein
MTGQEPSEGHAGSWRTVSSQTSEQTAESTDIPAETPRVRWCDSSDVAAAAWPAATCMLHMQGHLQLSIVCRCSHQPLLPTPTCRDNLRGFFEYCFPLLIKKIFGYDDREASWLFTVATVRRPGGARSSWPPPAPSPAVAAQEQHPCARTRAVRTVRTLKQHVVLRTCCRRVEQMTSMLSSSCWRPMVGSAGAAALHNSASVLPSAAHLRASALVAPYKMSTLCCLLGCYCACCRSPVHRAACC